MYFVPTRLRQSVGRITEDTRDSNKARVITYYRNSISALSAFLPALYLTKTDNVCFEDEYKGTPTLILVLDYKSSDNWHYCYLRFLFSKSSAECFLNIVFFLPIFLVLFVYAFLFFLIFLLQLFLSHTLSLSLIMVFHYTLFWCTLYFFSVYSFFTIYFDFFLDHFMYWDLISSWFFHPCIFLFSFVIRSFFVFLLYTFYLIFYVYITYYFIFFLVIHECYWYQIWGLFSSLVYFFFTFLFLLLNFLSFLPFLFLL